VLYQLPAADFKEEHLRGIFLFKPFNAEGYSMNRNTRLIFRPFFFALMVLFLASPVLGAKRTLVLFPLAIHAEAPKPFLRQGLTAMFQSRLSGGGLDVLTEESFGSLLTEAEKEGRITRERAQELAGKLKADYAVFGSVTTLGGGYSLDLSFLDLTKEKPSLQRVSEAMKEDEFLLKIADVANRFRALIEGTYVSKRPLLGPAPSAPGPEPGGGLFSRLGAADTGNEQGGFFRHVRQTAGFEPTGSLSLQMTMMAFDVGDLAGDGNLELAVLGRKQLRIYVRKDNTYQLRDTLKPSFGEDFLKVSVGDVDGNGKAEIYLVSRYGIRARSTVYEWDNTFRRLDRLTGHLRAVRQTDGGRPLLLFQDSKVDAFMGGDMWFMDYAKKGGLTKGKPLPRLKDARFYTLMPMDLDKNGVTEFIGLGNDDRLRVWDNKGVELWRGDKELGGTNNAIRLGKAPPGDLPPRIAFDAGLVFMDIKGDGRKEVIVAKNIPFVEHTEALKVFTKSRLIAYNQQGTSLSAGWDTKEISYSLVDLQAHGRTLFLAAQEGKMSDLMTGSSRVMWFDLQ
jgi:FG-GAP-like repeat